MENRPGPKAYSIHSKESRDIVSEDATQPVISPDGKHLMYIKLTAGKSHELWVADIDGGSKMKIATGESLNTGSWAPDNLQVSFAESGAGAVVKGYIVNADGSGLRQLARMEDDFWSLVWSSDQKSIYVSSTKTEKKSSTPPTVWKWNLDVSNPEKLVDDCGAVSDIDTDGRYLLGILGSRESRGIYEVTIADRKCIPLLPGVETSGATFSSDGKSFLYAVASRGEVTIYRQPWTDGKIIGSPQAAFKVPFVFPLLYHGNAYDFSRDLSTIVYTRPGAHADFYLLSQK
jgi:dipeptidyl aminopeptidase/acylaminoacyl peptidase